MDKVRIRARDTSQSFYLTLVSMISSLAFGFLLTSIHSAYDEGLGKNPIFWLQAIASAQAIILMWHEYVMGTVCYKWIIDYVDTIIPFLYAIPQYLAITWMRPDHLDLWYVALGIYGFITILAYINQYYKAANDKENKKIINYMNCFHRKTIIFALLAMAYFISAYFIVQKFYEQQWLIISMLLLCNVTFTLFGVVVHVLRKELFKDTN